ncbi:MAG: phosphate ABC transporter substrate-binding protein [Candidatus Lokiarchaeota archaeon]|nr:phosphate ABC transporter substrate-binding protein [Candidatus Lokiarchaeota archaeon]
MEGKTQTAVVAVIVAAIAIFSGIGIGFVAFNKPAGPQIQTISISGSTTVLPIATAAAEEYMAGHPNLDIQISGGGSSTGVAQAGQNVSDIGMSSREVKSSELVTYPNLHIYRICADGIAIIVNNGTAGIPATLSLLQLRGIYNGSYTNWNQVGGSQSVTIAPMGRDTASGTRATFDELVMGTTPTYSVSVQQLASNGLVQANVISTTGAIGYVGLGYADPEIVTVMPVDSVLPSTTTVLDGTYKISRSLYLLTGGTASGIVLDFINYIVSPSGQAIVEAQHFVPIGPTSW